MSARFVHLHVRSEFSLTDSIIRLPEKPEYAHPKKAPRPNLLSRAYELGQPAIALTDDSNVFALVKFYRAAEAVGIKPIAGADLWIAEPGHDPFRVTVLCKDKTGYLNLSLLLTRAYRNRANTDLVTVRRDWLDEQGEGLIALLGSHSDIGRAIAAGNDDAADAALSTWQRRFDDRVYLELCRTGLPADDGFVAPAAHLAAKRDCAAVATNDVRFLERDDFEAHEARVAIHEGWVLSDPKRPRRYSPEQYLKSPEEMAALFHDLPDALENTVELAKRCNFELSLGKYFLPAFPVPAESSEEQYLRESSRAGLEQRLQHPGPADNFTRADYDARLQLECDVIVKMGFSGYFLIVADFIGWAKKNGIPVGPGRGSGAGSLVAYCLGITDLDPLRFDLLFERFLNPERVSMPDFDVDFCMDRRDEVIDYVGERYGRERVAQIITYGTMAAKAVLRDSGRVLGMAYGHVDRIAKLVPARPIDIALDDALGFSEKAAQEPERVSAEFRKAYDEEEDVKQLVDLARKLEDLTRNAGKHAGGVVIAPSPLTDFAPLYAEHAGEGGVTQFDKDDVEAVGLVKFDFLGLRTLTIIDWAVKAINERHARAKVPPIDIVALPTDDKKTYELLKTGHTSAVFQLESRGMKELIRKLQPDVFDDIVALVALYRPGPLQSGMVDDFVDRKHGRAETAYPHPSLEPILKPTYGVIVYQEQVMQIAQVLAGYTLGGADMLRRAMGKKKPEEMAKERVKFETGAAANGVDTRLASAIFDLMEKFAEYGFNKSHSAAYALVAYQTAWLKAHYPSEFMAAVLSADMDKQDKLVGMLDEAKQMGLVVLKPDVNASRYFFDALPDGRVRYGLGAVKGVGRAAVEAIVEERSKHGEYASLFDLCHRVDAAKLNKRVLEALIHSGSLDGFGFNRASLMVQLPEATRAAEQGLRDREAGQNDMFGAASPAKVEVELKSVPEWPAAQRLNGERETLGYYLSGHPVDAWRGVLEQLASGRLDKLDTLPRPQLSPGFDRPRRTDPTVILGGLVANVRRRGDQMAFIQLEDGAGRIEASFFRESLLEAAPLLTKDRIILVEGWLMPDEFSGGFQLRGKGVVGLEDACERQTRMLKLELNGALSDFSASLKRALEPFRGGGTTLRLRYVTQGAATDLELGAQWRVRAAPELIAALRALPGVKAVEPVLSRMASMIANAA